MLPIVLAFITQVLPVIPSLVIDIENLFRGKPKAGAQKWISVEQALSQHISEAASQIAAAAPPGTKAEDISRHVAVYSRAVNDASVAFINALGLFPHAGAPPAIAAPPPAK